MQMLEKTANQIDGHNSRDLLRQKKYCCLMLRTTILISPIANGSVSCLKLTPAPKEKPTYRTNTSDFTEETLAARIKYKGLAY